MTVEATGYNILEGSISVDSNNTQGIAILFDYIQDETSSVEADITDNWVESNYSIQDHIAIKPRMYRLRGCVGEVVYENTWAALDMAEMYINQHSVLQKTIGVVNNISGLSGLTSNYTKIAVNLAKQIESSYDRYKKVWQNFQKRSQFVNKRQKAVYAILQQMLQTRTPVKLSSLMFSEPNPFIEGYYDRMFYLQSVSAHQGENAYISDIEVTIKEFRIATTKTTKIDRKKFAGLAGSQKTSEANNGDAKGNTVAPEKAQKSIKISTENLTKRAQTDYIKEVAPKNPIKKFFYQINKNTENYNKGVSSFHY